MKDLLKHPANPMNTTSTLDAIAHVQTGLKNITKMHQTIMNITKGEGEASHIDAYKNLTSFMNDTFHATKWHVNKAV